MINEDELEQECITWFKEENWDYVCGYDIAPDGDTLERKDYTSVVLHDRLLEKLKSINPKIPHDVLDEAAHRIQKTETPVLVKNNKIFHRYLIDGMHVDYKDSEGNQIDDYVNFIDFDNTEKNEFLIVNQFTVKGSKQNRRPDIIAFINGLPIAVIELKNPAGGEDTDIWHAYDQIQTYKDEICDLFVFNEANIISDGFHARIGSLTANEERYLPWRTIKNEKDKPKLEFQIETVIRGFFNKELLLDYIRYFVLFEESDGQTIKKIAAYHQFHAVREAVRATLIATANSKDEIERINPTFKDEEKIGFRKAGVVWHTQGSGKSISMTCYASKLLQQPEMNNPTLLIVTDRNDLDGQLYETFLNAKEMLKQIPVQAESRDDLRQLLNNRTSGGIIFTTIQKFSLMGDELNHPELTRRSNIVVISDEAHRSQYGFKEVFDEKSGQFKTGYAQHMRDAIPDASFIGFTGTPISQLEADTRSVFGDYVSVYDIKDAVDDGATVPIYYESRLAKLDINTKNIEKLNDQVDEVIEDDEYDDQEKAKSKWTALEKLVGTKDRINEIGKDIVEHFITRTDSVEGKGMIVCMSREICVDMFNAIIKVKPEWAGTIVKNEGSGTGYYDLQDGAIRIIMTGSATDKPGLQQHVYNKKQKKILEKRIKDKKDPLKLIIVRDMWLTGFDAPCIHTMYIDKPMKGHNLMQAIARVNRVFSGKDGGLVVDYIGIGPELKAALKTYTSAEGKGKPTHNSEEAYDKLLELIEMVRDMLHGFDYSGFETTGIKLLGSAANHILSLKDGKKRFFNAMAPLVSAHSLCGTMYKVKTMKKEIAFFSAIRNAIKKFTLTTKSGRKSDKQSALKEILDNAVTTAGIDDIFALAGVKKPDISILDESFRGDILATQNKNLAFELLKKLLNDQIKAKFKTDVVQEKKYSDRLLETIQKYHNRALETQAVIKELLDMASDMAADESMAESLGLNPDEVAFYRALAAKPQVLKEMKEEVLKTIAIELTQKLRSSAKVDWQKRESVRAHMRRIVRRLLKKYKYPPADQDSATDLVIKQAETLSEKWSEDIGE